MSFLPVESLQGASLITHYIVEYRGRGHFLPYDEHRVISKWLELAGDSDSLLLVLSDIVPEFYEKHAARSQPPSLSRLDRKVTTILNAQKRRLV